MMRRSFPPFVAPASAQRALGVGLLALASMGACGCSRGTGAGTSDGAAGGGGDVSVLEKDRFGTLTEDSFELVQDFTGPCEKTEGSVDVNLGHDAQSAVRSMYCQVYGEEPPEEVLSDWTNALINTEYVRRIDVARTFCRDAGDPCSIAYSNPWQAQVDLTEGCDKKTDRDLGAVMMYFSECPGGVNCSMDWANTHALGMDQPHVLYGFEDNAAGYYNPQNTGFWRREFLDARWAGLSFLALNTFGPDITAEGDSLARAAEALDDIGGGIGIALMDDTWGWGRFDAPFDRAPDLSDTENAASTIYQAKWKPFFEKIPAEHWYEYDGKPFVYFYNAGTLGPRDRAPAVIARLKEMFAADFGLEPFVAVDTAFFEDEEGMTQVADARFVWDSFNNGGPSNFTIDGVNFQQSMVRWDAVGRDRPGQIADASDRMRKGPQLLESFLQTSQDADIAVIATWNDLGEGTGINRNYDYFYGDRWLAPHHFMSLTREAQCNE